MTDVTDSREVEVESRRTECSWSIHSSIDPSLANDKARKAKSDDPGWKYGFWPNLNDKNTVQCLLCSQITKGGIKRLKEHLIGGFSDVAKCGKSTTAIREEMNAWINRGKKRKMQTSVGSTSPVIDLEGNDPPPPSTKKTVTTPDSGKTIGPIDINFYRQETIEKFIQERKASGRKQTLIEDHFKKEARLHTDRCIANCIYQCGLPFNIVNYEAFEVMVESLIRIGKGYRPPSFHAIRKTLLEEEYKDVADLKHKYMPDWKRYGVTLMTDGWTDKRGRCLLNFLVNCPTGTFFLHSVQATSEEKNADYLVGVIEDAMEVVGIENVVQICTDNASNYVLAGKKLMEKYPHIWWSPCAAHCLDLLLEDIGKLPRFKKVINIGRKITSFIYSHARVHDYFLKLSGGKELVRCGVTRFATSFLTLQSLLDHRDVLRKLFVSSFWMENSWRKEEQGKFIAGAVIALKYWEILEDCLRASQPILVLRLVDSDEKPTMTYLLSALFDCKQAIKDNFGGIGVYNINMTTKIHYVNYSRWWSCK